MYQRILVPIDGSHTSNKALQAALQMAKASGGCVRIIHLIDASAYLSGPAGYLDFPSDLPGAMRSAGNKVLEDAANLAKAIGVEAETHLYDSFDGKLADVVSNAALQWKADLIVVGTHGRSGVGRALLGSGAEQILRLAPMPVLVIRSDAQSSR